MLTHAERLAGPEANRGGGHKAGSVAALRRNDAASVIGRYARTTLVWKAQARALIKVRILAGACLACRPDARLTAPRAPEQDSGEPRGWCPAAARDAKKRKDAGKAKKSRAAKQAEAIAAMVTSAVFLNAKGFRTLTRASKSLG